MDISYHFARDYFGEYAALCRQSRATETRADFCSSLAWLLHTQEMPGETAAATANCLYERMNDARLAYHTPIHVLSIFSWAAQNRLDLELWEHLALWFHDAIYDPTAPAGINEDASALFMRSLLNPYLKRDVMEMAERAIQATALHANAIVDPAMRRVLDLDVVSMSWDSAAYEAVAAGIAQEHIPHYGQAAYQRGRRSFLENFLKKGFIYRSNFFKLRCEEAAIANLRNELARLSASPNA